MPNLQAMMEGKRFKTTWKSNDMVDFHIKAMGQQLKQLKMALKLAVALNRTIIMPKVSGSLSRCCAVLCGAVRCCAVPLVSWG